MVALLREDVRFTMPPEPVCYAGAEVARFFETEVFGPGGIGEFRLVATRASRQPAAANYIRAWDEDVFRAVTLDVLRIEDGLIREITTFDSGMFAMFGLPAARGRVRHRAGGDRR